MEDDVNVDKIEDGKIVKMGAAGNPNAARVAVLQERKKVIEELLVKKNQELRQLCVQEAELTGIMPLEMPLEPGESPPAIRRRVGTSYELSENLIQNGTSEDEELMTLELQIQLHANMAEAALGLANEGNTTKTIRRQHMSEYQKHKQEHKALQDKLAALKEKQLLEQQLREQQLQRMSRSSEQDDSISVTTAVMNSFVKDEGRHSLRSLRYTLSGDVASDPRLASLHVRSASRKSESSYIDSTYPRSEDILASGVYRLSINGYKNYIERRENMLGSYQQNNTLYQVSGSQYPNDCTVNYQQSHRSTTPISHSPQQVDNCNNIHSHIPHVQHQKNPHMLHHPANLLHSQQLRQQYSPLPMPLQQHSPYMTRHSTQMSHYCNPLTPQQQMSHHYHNQNSPQAIHHQRSSTSVISHSQHITVKQISDHNKNMLHYATIQNSQVIQQQSSPTSNNRTHQKVSCAPQPACSQSQNVESSLRVSANPLQLQPHQQYEQNTISSGLGGCWKKMESGEIIWCNTLDWQMDKRFGSLDRRKNKRILKRISPSDRLAALTDVPTSYQDHIRTASVKSAQVINRKSHDNRQLVRTQSLGSVGTQTLDGIWPSDDNSSCESDHHNFKDRSLKKNKQKQWLETSLDGPVSPTNSVAQSQSSVMSVSVLAPEEKYLLPSPSQSYTTSHPILQSPVQVSPGPGPILPKSSMEIPAESNPNQRLHEANLEVFNNNVPKNCTVVQAGQCKPYHEETKPFEMSDYYKYSTKFKKSPLKQENKSLRKYNQSFTQDYKAQKNLNDSFDECVQPNQADMSLNTNTELSNNTKPNHSSVDLDQLSPNEGHFVREVNTWYQNHHEQHPFENNSILSSQLKNSRSTDTLV